MTAGVYKYGLEWRERPGFSLADLEAQRRILFYEEGAEAVVAVAERPGSGRRYLSINGKTDAGSGAEDVVQQKFMGHVPLFLHPAPRRVLVVGWGAGATAQAVALHPGVEGVECIEIEPAVWRAAPLFDALSGRVRADPRFRMVLRDGRNHLLRSRERWDVVVSEPSNPWLAGVANLFTREFYETVLSRLAPGGVFGQWFHYYNFEPVDVKVELRTFQSVFPHVSLWVVPPVPGPEGGTLSADLLLIGSREPHAVDWERLRAAFAPGPLADDLRSTTVLADEAGVLAAWAMGGEDLSAYAGRSGPLNTDDRPWIEFVGPRRNAQPPAEVARQARAQYEEFARASAAPMAPLRGRGPDGPELSRVLVAVAERHAEAARPGRARLALERAVAADPEQADGWEKLGGVWLDAQDYPKAEAAHRQLLRLRPKDVAALLRHGAILARLGRWGEARDALLSARRLDPKAPIEPALLEYVEQQARR
jgi:spermidine synthase